ncbi:LysR family transcriptional regulator [Rhodobacterales bacterium HKCCE2091]|nr:LysR family transcriptional regulator [Rhodobacterales bacterium HKCCE2091]
MRNWDDLRIFLAVVRGGSLTGAGRRLRVDAATIGRRIARLERAVGRSLFVKSPQGYALTEAGQALVGPAEAAEAAAAEAERRATGAGEALSGTIRIGAPDGCATYLLPRICAGIAAENPGLEVQILSLPRVVDLSRREADLAIAVSRPKSARLTAEKLTDYRLSLAASRDWIARNGMPASLADLGDAPMIGYIPDMIFDAELDYLSGLGLPSVALASNSVSVQLQFVAAGAGLAIVHDFALPAMPDLCRVLPDEIALERAFWLIRHDGAPQDPRLARFADRLGKLLRAEVAAREAAVRAGGNA